jgi:hypothetical protein
MLNRPPVTVPHMLSDEKHLLTEVQFKTIFRAYICLLKLDKATSRDLQKAMAFATPTQAKYHLKKLSELGLIRQTPDNGSYEVVTRRFGVLRFFLKVRKRLVPTSLFYAAFFLGVTILLFLRAPDSELIFLGGLIVAKEVVEAYLYWPMV